MKDVFLGIDIGGTNTKYGFITADGEVLSSHIIPTNTGIDFKDYTHGLTSDVEENFKPHLNGYKLKAIGVGAPNANSQTGCIENPPNLKWDVVNLKEEFTTSFKLPVSIENDANVAAVGEKIFGAAKELENFVVITLGTGLGVGSFVNGELYLGTHGLGSEAGHMTIIPEGRNCSCGGQGHLEAYASCTGMKKTVNEALNSDFTFRDIAKKYVVKDTDITPLIELSAKHLALGLAGMNSLLAPQAFILCGGGTSLGESFRDKVESNFKQLAYAPYREYSRVIMSSTSNEYGAILGAASLVI